MKKTAANNIAIVCDDLTEFFVIKDAIDALKKKKLPVDVIIPFDSGYNGLAEHTLKKVKELGYSPLNDAPRNKMYKVLLTPYPGLEVVKRLKYIYHIRFPYGALSAKPNPTYLPSVKIDYDAIISFNTFDQSFLDAYGAKVYPIPYWRYYKFKPSPKNSDKPVLLVLPTFGADTSCANKFADSSIKAIKEKFHVIVKAHHAVHFGADGDETVENLKKLADEYYDSDIPIDQLLKKADLVLSDNSGAIFESICAGVPVALFADKLNSRHLDSIDTPQYLFASQGIIPHTDKTEKVLPMLLSIKSYEKKQQALRKQLFLESSDGSAKELLSIIDKYLSMDETKDYHKVLHDALVKEWYEHKRIIEEKEATIKSLNEAIEAIYNSTSWKVTKPLRALKPNGRNRV